MFFFKFACGVIFDDSASSDKDDFPKYSHKINRLTSTEISEKNILFLAHKLKQLITLLPNGYTENVHITLYLIHITQDC